MSSVTGELAGRPTSLGSLAALRRAWLGIDKNPAAIAFTATPVGTAVVIAAFLIALGASLKVSLPTLALTAVTLAAIAIVPARRIAIICGASIFFFVMRPFRISGWQTLTDQLAPALSALPAAAVLPAVALSFLAIAFAVLATMRRWPQSAVARRPVLSLILGWFGLLAAAMWAPPGTPAHALLWILTGVSISSLWYLAYAAIDLKGKAQMPVAARASFMRPFWGGSAIPIGKSFGYLSRFDARNEDELATTRLKGLKLAVWAAILSGLLFAVETVLYEAGPLVPLHDAVLAHAGERSLGTGLNWAIVVTNYFLDLVIIAVWGHVIVATVRMCGWRIPRNTVNPLASRTLAEFWNRYFFYFKELLVDLFFYPAFLRYFKGHTRLRIAFATLCAAGLGNFLYHFMRETYVFATADILDTIWIFQSAIFYSLVLAAGLIVSQWRGRKAKPEDGFFAYHVWPRLNVMAFFCFLKIFDDISGEGTLLERAAFTASLFGG